MTSNVCPKRNQIIKKVEVAAGKLEKLCSLCTCRICAVLEKSRFVQLQQVIRAVLSRRDLEKDRGDHEFLGYC